MLDPRRLLLLRSVARHGSLARAAEQIGITTSALSQHMRKLEREARLPLIERHSRGVSLTPAGSTLLARADSMATDLEALDRELDELRAGTGGTVRCGVFPTIAAALMPTVLLTLSEHDSLRLSLRSARLRTLEGLVKSRDLDVALTWDYPWARRTDTDLVDTPFITDPTVLLVPSAQANLQWHDVLSDRTRWVSRADGHMIGEVLTRVGEDLSFRPRVAYEANDWNEAQAVVAAGLGVALAPALATDIVRDGVAVLDFPPGPQRTVYFTRLAGHRPVPAERVVEQAFTRAWQTWEGQRAAGPR